jgi:hypothetical protein
MSGNLTAQNLVANGNFDAGNSGFTSEYPFSNINSTEGQYGIVTDPKSWNGSMNSFGDHTSGAGNMLIVNGKSDGSSAVLWTQQINVVPNHVYFFSAWAANVSSRQPSTFVLRINGVIQQPTTTLPTQPALWLNYTTIWNSDVSTSALLEIVIVSTEVIGNDTAFDDIVFREASSTPVPVSVAQAVWLDWNSDIQLDYQIQNSSNLEVWTNTGLPISGTGNPMTHCEKITQPKKFFRVIGLKK